MLILFFIRLSTNRQKEETIVVAVGEGGEGVILSSQIDPQLMTDV